MVVQVPFTGDEKQSLRVSLDRHRDAVLWKLEGLGDDDLRRHDPVRHQPAGAGEAPGGGRVRLVLRHLRPPDRAAAVRRRRPGRRPAGRPDETTEDVLAFYGRARSAADKAIDELELEATGTAWFGDAVSMRWVLIHMIEETARHPASTSSASSSTG